MQRVFVGVTDGKYRVKGGGESGADAMSADGFPWHITNTASGRDARLPLKGADVVAAARIWTNVETPPPPKHSETQTQPEAGKEAEAEAKEEEQQQQQLLLFLCHVCLSLVCVARIYA